MALRSLSNPAEVLRLFTSTHADACTARYVPGSWADDQVALPVDVSSAAQVPRCTVDCWSVRPFVGALHGFAPPDIWPDSESSAKTGSVTAPLDVARFPAASAAVTA